MRSSLPVVHLKIKIVGRTTYPPSLNVTSFILANSSNSGGPKPPQPPPVPEDENKPCINMVQIVWNLHLLRVSNKHVHFLVMGADRQQM